MSTPADPTQTIGMPFDLLGDAPNLTLETERPVTVRKKWGPQQRSERNVASPHMIIVTTKNRLKVVVPPIAAAELAPLLKLLRPNFQQVLQKGQQVMAMETDTGMLILSGGHIAEANLVNNGYCVAYKPTKAEINTLKSREFQLLYTSYFYEHKRRERLLLIAQWESAHNKVFKSDDVVRNLSRVFKKTPRTIYNDLTVLSKNK